MSGREMAVFSCAALMAALTLAGCGGGGDEASSSVVPSVSASTTSAARATAASAATTALGSVTTAPALPVAEPVPAPPRTVSSALQLSLPAIGVDAPVIEAGVTASRVLQIPEDPAVLGRWSDGARPGDGTGSVVLAGHVDYNGRPGALKPLASLAVGDEAVLATADGEARYVTDRVDVYAKQVLPYEEIFLYDVPERLVLITCGGRFDRASGHYESNVVAYLRRV